MAASFPSIQSFFSKEVQPGPPATGGSGEIVESGDGFTTSEVQAAVEPLSRPWKPSRTYEPCAISLLETGPRNYEISGRIVNFSTNPRQQRGRTNLEGHYFLVVADETGAIVVRLFYDKPSDYELLLGQRITMWTTYVVHASKAEIGRIPFCASSTTIYPGRNGATHITFFTDAPESSAGRSLRRPLETMYPNEPDYPGLMTLEAFLSSDYDLGEGKILICVRSIGPRKAIQLKKLEGSVDLVEVGVFDDTATCVLKLWGDQVSSAKNWVPNRTMLLISSPTCKNNGSATKQAEVGIGYSSMVNVDPEIAEATWLRKRVLSMAKKDSVYIPFPTNTWNIDMAMNGPNRTLFTISELEDQVRHQEVSLDFTGKLNVIIVSTHMMEYRRKNAFCCVECCGIPLCANKPLSVCRNCGAQRELSLNPRILGAMIDESGSMSSAKLVWNDDAWTQLLVGSFNDEINVGGDGEVDLVEQGWAGITILDNNALRDIEEQLLYSRVILTFGWSSALDRLCILGVES
ncbi:hypothetical protein F4778DRAFT_772781 [Xylariomycetidae sp. FL2044]|nr:hypothetical protein F4778DRAFT_772781 [Xylariomycetidae sp. FL2044]